ncbi:hypothetical protein AAG906_036514 [Vitis piasezkii]
MRLSSSSVLANAPSNLSTLAPMFAQAKELYFLSDSECHPFLEVAAIVNVFMGAAIIMPIGMTFLVAFMSDHWMILLSSLAYSLGLSFLARSTPPVLSNATGTCSLYQPECIGNTQGVLFCTALALIAVGISGHITSLRSFFTEQGKIKTPSDQIDMKRKVP